MSSVCVGLGFNSSFLDLPSLTIYNHILYKLVNTTHFWRNTLQTAKCPAQSCSGKSCKTHLYYFRSKAGRSLMGNYAVIFINDSK